MQLNLFIVLLLTAASCYAATASPLSSADLDPVNQHEANKSADDSAAREKKSYVPSSGCIEVHGPSHATYSICNSAGSAPILPSYAAGTQYGGITHSSAPQYRGHASIALPSAQIASPEYNGGFGSISLPSGQQYDGGQPIYPVNQGPIYRSEDAAMPTEFMANDMAIWQQMQAQLTGAGVVPTDAGNARSVYGGGGAANAGGTVGVFPTLLAGGGCGATIPLLLTCNPNVVQGNILNSGSTHGYGGWNNPISGASGLGSSGNAGYQGQLGLPIGYRQNGGSSQTVAAALNNRKGSANTQDSKVDKTASNQLHREGVK